MAEDNDSGGEEVDPIVSANQSDDAGSEESYYDEESCDEEERPVDVEEIIN